MAENLIATGIEFDSRPMAQSIDQAERKLESLEDRTNRAGRAAKNAEKEYNSLATGGLNNAALAAQRAREAAAAMADAYEVQFKMDMARIKEGQARGFLTPTEAQKAGTEAAQAYNQGMVRVLDQGTRGGAFQGPQGREAFTQIAGSIKNVDDASKGASIGVGQLNYTLGSLASRAASAHPVTGQLAASIGSFAMGGAITAGVLVGIAAIGMAWQRLSSDAKELKKDTDAAIESLEKLAKERQTQGDISQIERNNLAAGRRDVVAAELQRLRNAAAPTGEFAPAVAAQRAHRIRELEAEYENLSEIITEGEADLSETRTDRQKAAADNEAAELERQRRERERLAREAAKVPEFDRLMQGLEQQRLGFVDSERAAYAFSLALNKELTPAQRDQLLVAYDATEAAREQSEQREKDARAADELSRRITSLNDSIQAEYLALTSGIEASRRYELAQQGITGAIADQIIVRERRNRQLKDEQDAAEKAAKKAQDEALRAAEAETRKLEAASDRMAGSVSDAFMDIVTGTEKVEDAFRDMVDGIIREMLRLIEMQTITEPLAGFFVQMLGSFAGAAAGGGGTATANTGGVGFAAEGGPIDAGRPYVVGERGMEIVVPSSNSMVIPNSAMGMTLHQTVQFNISAMDAASVAEVMRSQKGTIAAVVREAAQESTAFRQALR